MITNRTSSILEAAIDKLDIYIYYLQSTIDLGDFTATEIVAVEKQMAVLLTFAVGNK